MESIAQIEKLMKVLALTDSDQDGEALAALRQARQMLFAHGLSMTDLAATLADAPVPRQKRAEIDITRGLIKAYEARFAALEQENQRLQKELVLAERAISRWRDLAESTNRDSAKYQAAADKWRALARNTADHLWELGQQLHGLDAAPSDHTTDDNVVTFTKPRP